MPVSVKFAVVPFVDLTCKFAVNAPRTVGVAVTRSRQSVVVSEFEVQDAVPSEKFVAPLVSVYALAAGLSPAAK